MPQSAEKPKTNKTRVIEAHCIAMLMAYFVAMKYSDQSEARRRFRVSLRTQRAKTAYRMDKPK